MNLCMPHGHWLPHTSQSCQGPQMASILILEKGTCYVTREILYGNGASHTEVGAHAINVLKT